MRYVEPLYRPPSEANSYIVQATIGCSWNACTYCDMYRSKRFEVRPLAETLEDIALAARQFGPRVDKVFVADGDALVLDIDTWMTILDALQTAFPRLRRVSCYATATNLIEKTPEELSRLREAGLKLLYIGPESGDDTVLKKIAKGATFDEHVTAARVAHDAGMQLSAIFLLGAGGTDRSDEHARASARLATAMDPRFLSLLTLTIKDDTPIARQASAGRFTLPDVDVLLGELRTFVAEAAPTDAIFRTNHASNWLPLAGRLPRDRDRILAVVDDALDGGVDLRADWMRGL